MKKLERAFFLFVKILEKGHVGSFEINTCGHGITHVFKVTKEKKEGAEVITRERLL